MSQRPQQSQQGIALILVIIIIAFATVIAMQLISMRGIYYQRAQNMVQSENAWGYAAGAETLARIAIDQSLQNEDTVHLGQLWASQKVVFPIDGGQLTAELADLRSCFNVNMVTPGIANNTDTEGTDSTGADNSGSGNASITDNEKKTPGQRVFENLVNHLSREATDLPEASVLGARLRDWVDFDTIPSGFEGAEDQEYMGYEQPYRTANQNLVSVGELRTISGFSAEIIEVLQPYLCVVPDNNDLVINVNTIAAEQPELLASFYDNMTLDTAASILAARPVDGFTKADYDPLVPADMSLIPGAAIDFTSEYFAATIEVQLGDTRTRLKSLLFYNKGAGTVQTLARLGHND